jgi:hypothetical protein
VLYTYRADALSRCTAPPVNSHVAVIVTAHNQLTTALTHAAQQIKIEQLTVAVINSGLCIGTCLTMLLLKVVLYTKRAEALSRCTAPPVKSHVLLSNLLSRTVTLLKVRAMQPPYDCRTASKYTWVYIKASPYGGRAQLGCFIPSEGGDWTPKNYSKLVLMKVSWCWSPRQCCCSCRCKDTCDTMTPPSVCARDMSRSQILL